MIAIATPKLVAGFRDGRQSLYEMTDETGAMRAGVWGLEVVPIDEARAANMEMWKAKTRTYKDKPEPCQIVIQPACDRVLSWLKCNPGPHTAPAIRRGVRIGDRRVRSALHDLVCWGEIVVGEPNENKTRRWQAIQ